MLRCPHRIRICVWLCSLALALGALVSTAGAASAGFNHFESGHVRPLALSPDGTRLFAVNTPDNRLDIFAVDASGLTRVASVMVGLEPVAVAARSDGEVWVVNHLSDSVSIVEIDAADPTLSRVVRTLLVGDEPRDIVFAGPGGSRAFITTARRGQHLPVEELGREPEHRSTQSVDQQELNEIVEGEAEEPVDVTADDPTHPHMLLVRRDTV